MSELIAALVSMFLLGPLEARLGETLREARAPQAVVAEVGSCAREAAPRLTDRVTSDPVWGVQAAFRLWLGAARPEALLVEAAPGCRAAVEAAGPYWQGRGA